MGIIEVATVIPITMTIIDTKITISIMRRLRRLPEGGAGSLNRWVAFFNGSKSRFRSWIIITFFLDISGSLIVAQCSRIYSYVCYTSPSYFNPDHPAHIFCLSV